MYCLYDWKKRAFVVEYPLMYPNGAYIVIADAVEGGHYGLLDQSGAVASEMQWRWMGEVVDEVVRPSKSEPLSAASGNQEEPPKEREHVVPPPESDFIRNHILLVRPATNVKAKGPKL